MNFLLPFRENKARLTRRIYQKTMSTYTRPGASTFSVCISANFFSLWFPVVLYPGPSQVHTERFQRGPVWSQGPKTPLFGKSFRQNYVNVHMKVLQLHNWSENAQILHGASWHIGELTEKLSGMYCFSILKYHLQHNPKDIKNVCPPENLLTKVIHFKHFTTFHKLKCI